MLSIFSLNFLYIILAVAAIVGVVILCYKFPVAKTITITLFSLAVVGLTVYSSYNLIKYYSADSKIYGTISNLFKPNEAEKEELKFKLNNVVLIETGNDAEYIAEFLVDETIELEDNVKYGIFINGIPCDNSTVDKAHASGNFIYSFYNSSNEQALIDNLTISLGFYTNSTRIVLKTLGGSEAMRYWQDYFKFNNVELEIKELNYNSLDGHDISTDVLETQYYIVRYYIDNELYTTQVYKSGTILSLADYSVADGYVFSGWLDTDNNSITNGLVVEADMNLFGTVEQAPTNEDNETPGSGEVGDENKPGVGDGSGQPDEDVTEGEIIRP